MIIIIMLLTSFSFSWKLAQAIYIYHYMSGVHFIRSDLPIEDLIDTSLNTPEFLYLKMISMLIDITIFTIAFWNIV